MNKLIASLAVSALFTLAGCAAQPLATVVRQSHEERLSDVCKEGDILQGIPRVDGGFRLYCETDGSLCYVYGPSGEEYVQAADRLRHAAGSSCYAYYASCTMEALAHTGPGESCFGLFQK